MASIYIHIPFCKKACSYCNFHFSTSLKHVSDLVSAIVKELEIRKEELHKTPIQNIYFGGGTPSLLSINEITQILNTISKHYRVLPSVEITFECNPENIKDSYLKELKKIGINRISLGIQSFNDNDLKFMNRIHTAKQSHTAITLVQKYFHNFSLDLIYGLPNSTNADWKKNIKTALTYNPPHLSCYALTVEEKTALMNDVKKQKVIPLSDELTKEQFDSTIELLEEKNYVHYEISNFGLKGYFSQNNIGYWTGTHYLGIGPSAHSYNGIERSWNISNNILYINQIKKNILPIKKEKLSLNDRYNEYMMTGLRTKQGVSLELIEQKFGEKFRLETEKNAQKYIEQKIISISNSTLSLTKKGLFMSDGIASSFFKIG